jgi:hypothetical protein
MQSLAGDNKHPDYDELVRLYGEAMIRVGELEAKVAELTNQLGTQEDAQAPRGRGTSVSTSSELQALADKIDTLGRRMTESGESGPDPSSQPSEEFSQLRLQITSMANQLAVAQDELAKLRGSRRRRSPRTLAVPWWKALGRRLGLSKSRRP